MARNTFIKKLRAILIDILGVLMLIGAVLFGWLPGPGGVPLLLGGLGLLSINHVWAKNLLLKVRAKGSSLYDVFFPNNKKIHWLYDGIGIGIGALAIYIITIETKNITQSLAIAAVFVAIGLLATNRRRLEKFAKTIQRLKSRKRT